MKCMLPNGNGNVVFCLCYLFQFARKRQVAILKAQQKNTEAIEKLNEYLKK